MSVRTPSILAVLVLTLALARLAHAGAEIHVRSDVPAQVLFDGQPLGSTPLDIVDVHGGHHDVLLRTAKGQEQRDHVRIRRHERLAYEVTGRFAGGAPAPLSSVRRVSAPEGGHTAGLGLDPLAFPMSIHMGGR